MGCQIGSFGRVVAWGGIVFLLSGCATPGRIHDARSLRERAETEEAALLERVKVYDESYGYYVYKRVRYCE